MALFDSSRITNTIKPIQDIKVTPNIKVIKNINNSVPVAQNFSTPSINSIIPLGRNNTFSIPQSVSGSLPKNSSNRMEFSSIYVAVAIAIGLFIFKDKF